jgi:pantetheine-phosphate adenylyltransferase
MAPSKPSIALFPGTFDPLTNGHLDLLLRAQKMFNEVVVAVGTNPEKRELFTPAERVDIIRKVAAAQNLKLRVEQYDGLTVDYAKRIGATVILRGIRNHTDLDFEFQLALTNRAVADVETVFVMTSEQHGFTSSTLIKQIAASGRIEHLRRLLPALVVEKIEDKLKNHRHLLASLAKDANKE